MRQWRPTAHDHPATKSSLLAIGRAPALVGASSLIYSPAEAMETPLEIQTSIQFLVRSPSFSFFASLAPS